MSDHYAQTVYAFSVGVRAPNGAQISLSFSTPDSTGAYPFTDDSALAFLEAMQGLPWGEGAYVQGSVSKSTVTTDTIEAVLGSVPLAFE